LRRASSGPSARCKTMALEWVRRCQQDAAAVRLRFRLVPPRVKGMWNDKRETRWI